MKLIVTATEKDLDAQVDPRFGRCHYFITVDPDTYEYNAVENNQKNALGGAGVQAAESVANAQIDALITGAVGPKAFQTLKAANIKIYTGASGTVKEAIAAYLKGELEETNSSTVNAHHGINNRGQ